MGLLRKILGPQNSILLLYDHLSDRESGKASVKTMESFEEEVAEVGKYYRFTRLSEIVGGNDRANATGCAAILFQNARKSIFLHAVPMLRSEKIPFTLFLRPDCIGLNRLPPEEEIAVYQQKYPERFPASTVEDWKKKGWEDPAAVESFVLSCRREVGPLPIGDLDPTFFFATWGKIVDTPPDLIELGLYLWGNPRNEATFREAITFIKRQTGVLVRMAFSPQLFGGEKTSLGPLGIEGLVTLRTGPVERTTNPLQLPHWLFEREG